VLVPDGFADGSLYVEINDKLDATGCIQLMRDVFPDDQVFAGYPVLIANPAAEGGLDVDQYLQGIVTMDMGYAVGKEDGGKTIPHIEIRAKGAGVDFHELGNSVIIYNFFGGKGGRFDLNYQLCLATKTSWLL
jgi:hypothetical protein